MFIIQIKVNEIMNEKSSRHIRQCHMFIRFRGNLEALNLGTKAAFGSKFKIQNNEAPK